MVHGVQANQLERVQLGRALSCTLWGGGGREGSGGGKAYGGAAHKQRQANQLEGVQLGQSLELHIGWVGVRENRIETGMEGRGMLRDEGG